MWSEWWQCVKLAPFKRWNLHQTVDDGDCGDSYDIPAAADDDDDDGDDSDNVSCYAAICWANQWSPLNHLSTA